MIDEWFKWNMHDNFLPWHFTVDLNVLKNVLNNLHPTIKFSEDQAKFENISETMISNFLDITISLNKNGYAKTDLFYKKTKTLMIIITIVVIILTT